MENMKNNKNKKLNNKGFSLVELIVVVLILGILAAAVTPSFMKYVNQARENTDKMNAGTYKSAIRIALLDAKGIPTSGSYALKLTKGGVTEYATASLSSDVYTVTSFTERKTTEASGVVLALINAIEGGVSDWADAQSDGVFVAIIHFTDENTEPEIFVNPVSKTALKFNADGTENKSE